MGGCGEGVERHTSAAVCACGGAPGGVRRRETERMAVLSRGLERVREGRVCVCVCVCCCAIPPPNPALSSE